MSSYIVDGHSSLSPKMRELEVWLDSWVACGVMPGASLGIFDENGKELFFHYSNSKSLPVQFSRDSLLRIYSMTKTVTSIAALILVERGIVSLDDEVSIYLPKFANTEVYVSGSVDNLQTEPMKNNMKIRHLLTHTSGLSYAIFGNHVCDQLLQKSIGEDCKSWFHFTDLATLCDKIAECPLMFQPGTHFHYGLSTDVLGRVIEIASGISLDTFFQREIFAPLGMDETYFQVPPDQLHRLVDCYEIAPGQSFKQSNNLERDRSESPILLSGGGGLVSSIKDFAKLTTCLVNRGELKGIRILSDRWVDELAKNQLPDNADLNSFSFERGFAEVIGDGFGFGLGVSVLQNPSLAKGGSLSNEGEYGWGGVAGTYYIIDPVNKVSVIFMTQVIGIASVYPIRPQLRWLVHHFINTTH